MEKIKDFFGGLTKDKFLGLLRHVLTFVGGLLIMMGLLDESLWVEITGGVITFAGALWSWVQKRQEEKKLEEAKQSKKA